MLDFDKCREIYAKCVYDKSRIYMIETFLKTYDATQSKMVPYELFPKQKELCIAIGKNSNIVSQKPRQAGVTTTCGAYVSAEMCLADPTEPQTVLVIGKDLELACQMVTKVRDFLLQYPRWMWGDELLKDGKDPEGLPNKKEIFDICNKAELILKNGCRVVARSSGPDASRGVGGCRLLILDESAFIENGRDVYASAVPVVSTGGKIIMISTPNGKDTLYYETCRRAKLKGTSEWNNFELVEMKWYQDPRYNKFLEWTRKNQETGDLEVYKEEYLDKKGNIRYDEKHWEKMVQDGWKPRSPWYITMCQQFNNDEQKIAQELDVSFLGSASNVISPEAIEMQRDINSREPLSKKEDGDPLHIDDTWIWKKPIPGHRYVMALDNSRGDAADRTALEILDIDAVDDNGIPTIEQVLEYHGKKTGDDMGEIAYVYGMWYGEAFCVVDCIGGTGDASVLMLMRKNYKNLYYDDAELNKYTMQRERSALTPVGDKLPGFHSNAVRFQMLTYFANMVKTNQIKVRSVRAIQEMETWIYKGDQGRIDHMDGCHDDTLTCMAMAVFVVQYSMNKLIEAKKRDEAVLRSWVNATQLSNFVGNNQNSNEISIRPSVSNKYAMPFYKANGNNVRPNPYGPYMWVIR